MTNSSMKNQLRNEIIAFRNTLTANSASKTFRDQHQLPYIYLKYKCKLHGIKIIKYSNKNHIWEQLGSFLRLLSYKIAFIIKICNYLKKKSN